MIEFKDIAKVYPGNQVACENVNIKIEDGEFVCFIGTSGSGKTTCMRMINRMTEPTRGSVLINGKDIKDENPVELRKRIGYVIQQIGLMPHMTIFENIVMVPRLLKWDETKLRPIAENLIERVDLPKEYLDRYPYELSGGQQQRIGVIRALAADQDIILMDEPFGALDPITRNSLQQLIKSLQREMGKTVVFVTHDMNEALQLSDKIVIMDKGHVIQIGTPENILKNPETEYVKELLGEEKLNEAKTSYNTVETIMLKNPVHAHANTTPLDAIKIMRSKRVDTLFVTDDNGVLLGHVGIFDLVKIGRQNVPLKTVLDKSHPIPNTTKIIEAIHQIYELKVKNLPVVDSKGRLVGIVTRASIVDTIYENLWSEVDTDEEIIDITSSEELKKLTEEAKVNAND